MDIGYLLIICLVIAIITGMAYDIFKSGIISLYHLLVLIMVLLVLCILPLIQRSTNTNDSKKAITVAGNTINKINTVNTETNLNVELKRSGSLIASSGNVGKGGVVPNLEKQQLTASPLVPNSYDVCIGLLDGKSPAELASIADSMRSTTSDKVIERDASSLNPHWKDSPTEERRLIAMEIYPFMSGNQINTHDCLNDQGNGKSCFQSPSLMTSEIMNGVHLVGDNLAANSKRGHFSNQATAVLNLREGFESPAPVDFPNAPGNPGRVGRLITDDMCTHCKIGTCFNGYCGDSNYYFF